MDILLIQIGLGLVAVILFRYKNPVRHLINSVSIFVSTVFLSRALLVSVSWGLYFWAASTFGLLVVYVLRFIKKEVKKPFDWCKLLGIIALTLYPLSAYTFVGQIDSVEYYLENLIIPVLGTMYIYDRLIFKTEMKKRFIMILSIQSILILLMLTYSIVQKVQADKQVVRAEMERSRADKLEYELTKLRSEKENDGKR